MTATIKLISPILTAAQNAGTILQLSYEVSGFHGCTNILAFVISSSLLFD